MLSEGKVDVNKKLYTYIYIYDVDESSTKNYTKIPNQRSRSYTVELLYEIKTENILESREKNLFMRINYRVKFLRLLIRVKRD